MEVDRIQQIKGLRIERTGSEQERRRRPQTEEDFQELLESDLKDEEQQDKPQDKQEHPSKPADTVSITGGTSGTPIVNDLVSISTTALVSAEVRNAQKSVKQNGEPASVGLPADLAERRNSQLQPHAEADEEPADTDPASEDEEPEDDEQPRVDTLA